MATASAEEGIIKTSRGKARCKSTFMVHQLLMFFAPVDSGVVKIVHSSFKVVL
jgi:hypothetical protein